MATIIRFVFSLFVVWFLAGLAKLPEIPYWLVLVGGTLIAFLVLEVVAEVKAQSK